MEQIKEQCNYNYEYDEIDLRDIIKTLGKWKKTIISVTLICTLLSGIVSFFFIDPVYQATTLVAPASLSRLSDPSNIAYIVTDENYMSVTDSKKMSDNVDNIIKLTQVDVSRYPVILTSNEILQSTIKELGLDLTPAQLKGQIKVESLKEMSDVSQVMVTDTDPELAALIANTLVNKTASYLNELNSKKMEDLARNLETQQAVAQDNLDEAFANLKRYQAGNKSPDWVQNEIELNKLQNEVDRWEDIVKALSSKILELKVLQSFDSVENKVVVLSPAVVPETPVKPNKMLNIAIAAVLGLMVSVFGAFLMEYLREDK